MLNINGLSWRVLLVSANHPSLMREDGTWSIGACDNVLRTIYVCDEIEQNELKKVLAHELTHAAMFSYNIMLNWQQEEMLADLIATYGQEIVYKTNIFFKHIKENREALC